MNGQTKVAISLLLGAVIIAVAVYLGLSKSQKITVQPKTGEPTVSVTTSPTPSPSSQVTRPTVEALPEISWTKSDIIAALSIKTGIPEAEIVFSTGETVDYNNTKLIRGTVQRQGEMGGAGFFAMVDTSGVTVTYAGQGVPECSEVNPYGYPLTWADYCMSGGSVVQR